MSNQHTITLSDFADAAGFELTPWQREALTALDGHDACEMMTMAPVQYGKSYVRALRHAQLVERPHPKTHGNTASLIIVDECYCPCGYCTSTMEDCESCGNSPTRVSELRTALGLPQMPGKGCGSYRARMQYEGLIGGMR